MQLIIDLRLNLVRELLNDKALEGDAEQRLTALLHHRYEEEVPALLPSGRIVPKMISRPLGEAVRELLHAYCQIAMRHYKVVFTFDQLHAHMKATAGSTAPGNTKLYEGLDHELVETLYSGRYLPTLRNCFAEYVITKQPIITGPGVEYRLVILEGLDYSYIVRCHEVDGE